jgi:glycosyltransferase involved in cell wall biosynthesis
MISFIVPAHNAEKTIKKCLDSILKQGVEKEVIVVDNASTNGSADIIKTYQDVVYLFEAKRGPGAARNRGLEIARGEYVAFVDSDVVLPKDWTKKALFLLNKDRSLGGVGGPGKSIEKNALSNALDALLFGKSQEVAEKYVDSLATMDALYRRKAIGNDRFDETLIAGEDPELNFRIRKKGYKLLYSRELFVYHHHAIDLKSLLKRWYNYGRYYPLPYKKHPEFKTVEYYVRIMFVPIFLTLMVLSFWKMYFVYVALLQMFLLFLTYTYIGVRVRGGFLFPFIHTLKQIAQLWGIFVGMLERI